jgi:cell division protein FtsL
MFLDWCSMLFTGSEKHFYALVVAAAIHALIYCGLFGLQFVTMSTKTAIQRLESLRDNAQSSYAALELNSILQQSTILNDDPDI